VSAAARQRRRLILTTCCAVHAVQDGLVATLYVVLPILAATFGLSYAQVGVMRAVHTSAMSLLEIPSGVLAERLGERTLLAFGLGLAASGYLLLSASDGVAAIGASLFVAGIGAAFQHALSSSVISASYAGSAPRSALGTYNSAGDAGKLAFTAAFSLLLGVGASWQAVVAGFGSIALLAALAVFVALGAMHVGGGGRSRGAAPGAGRSWGIRDRGAFAALVTVVLLDIGVQTGFLTFLAFLMLEKQVPPGLASVAVVLTLGGGILGKFGCGYLAEHLGPRRALIVVEVLTALGIVAVLMAPTLLAYCLLPVLGLVLQGSSSITYATVPDLVARDRHARCFALIYTVSGVAAVAAPVAFGFVGDRFGLGPAMLAMAFAVMLTVPLTTLMYPAAGVRRKA
jgi:MFS family permease